MNDTIRNTRLKALKYWKESTGRKRNYKSDNLLETYECKWQNKHDGVHVSVFCTLGEWADNITDILSESKYDKLSFSKKSDRKALFRYYTRLLLVVSEILTDFQDLYILGHRDFYKHQKKENGQRYKDADIKNIARTVLSPDIVEFQQLLNYINTVCKHKAKGYHINNHHNDYYFEDSKHDNKGETLSSLSNLKFEKDMKISIPKQEYILSLVIECYKKTNSIFNSSPQVFAKICECYKF